MRSDERQEFEEIETTEKKTLWLLDRILDLLEDDEGGQLSSELTIQPKLKGGVVMSNIAVTDAEDTVTQKFSQNDAFGVAEVTQPKIAFKGDNDAIAPVTDNGDNSYTAKIGLALGVVNVTGDVTAADGTVATGVALSTITVGNSAPAGTLTGNVPVITEKTAPAPAP
jgi:hypothetical protein